MALACPLRPSALAMCMPVVALSPAEFQKLGQAAVHIANAEGLSGHASAIKVRLDSLTKGA